MISNAACTPVRAVIRKATTPLEDRNKTETTRTVRVTVSAQSTRDDGRAIGLPLSGLSS